MMRLEVREMGETLGIELPAELLEKHSIKKGDCLYAKDVPDGVHLSVREPDCDRQMQIAQEGMEKYRDALRDLADK